VVEDLKTFSVQTVVKKGKVVWREGEFLVQPSVTPPEKPSLSIRVASLPETCFQIPAAGKFVQVMEVVPGQIITRKTEAEARIENDLVVADPDRDIIKIAVVNGTEEPAM
jgi:adenine deaminase